MAKKAEPQSKSFNLRPAESQLLAFTKHHQDAIFSGLLSTIAADRMSYPVTERTQFQLNADMNELTVIELPEPEEDKAQEESPIKEAK